MTTTSPSEDINHDRRHLSSAATTGLAAAGAASRVVATKWPEKETVADDGQGVRLATTQKLARYWATDHDWRKCEAKINAVPNFVTESWAEKAYVKLVHYGNHPRGTHFAAWEQPALFVSDARATFKSLRSV